MSRIYISESQKRQIFEQLEKAYPNEGAGFLLGHFVEGHIAATDVVIDEVIAAENASAADEQYHRFVMTPKDWMRLEDEADARGLTLIGCFHSHPDSPAIPSDFDREHSYPNFLYLIASVMKGRAQELRSWELARDGHSEHTTALVSDRDWREMMKWPTVR